MDAIFELLSYDRRVGWIARANIGAMRNRSGRYVRFGWAGMADLTGMMKDGRRLEIEVKAETGRVTRDQAAFLALVRRYDGVAGVVHSLAEVDALLNSAVGASLVIHRRRVMKRHE